MRFLPEGWTPLKFKYDSKLNLILKFVNQNLEMFYSWTKKESCVIWIYLSTCHDWRILGNMKAMFCIFKPRALKLIWKIFGLNERRWRTRPSWIVWPTTMPIRHMRPIQLFPSSRKRPAFPSAESPFDHSDGTPSQPLTVLTPSLQCQWWCVLILLAHGEDIFHLLYFSISCLPCCIPAAALPCRSHRCKHCQPSPSCTLDPSSCGAPPRGIVRYDYRPRAALPSAVALSTRSTMHLIVTG
jgi:hypothetical protein